MDCFAKYIDSPTDVAVRGEFVEANFIPFALLAFSDFCNPPSVMEVRFLVDLMFGLTGLSHPLLVCRNTREQDREFTQKADHAFPQLRGADTLSEGRNWQDSHCYLIDCRHRAVLTTLIHAYWRVWYGNWLFAHWPPDGGAVERGLTVLRSPERRISRVRASLLGSRSLAALTFDDKLFDLYTVCSIEHVVAAAQLLAKENSIELRSVTDEAREGVDTNRSI